MRYRSLVCAITISLFVVCPAFAIEDFEAGREAAHRGDFSTAYQLWKKASDAGDAKSTFALGKMYFYGHGVDKDLLLSKKLVGEAAQQGVPGAREYVARIEKELSTGGSAGAAAGSVPKAQASQGSAAATKSDGDTPDQETVNGVMRDLRASYDAISAQYPAAGVDGESAWSVVSKVDPMSDVRTIEALTRIEMGDNQSSFELKLVCAPDGSGTSMTVTSSPDSFARRPAPSGKPFIFYSVRFGNQPARTRGVSDRVTKFSNVLSVSFPVKAYMPMMLRYARQADQGFDFAISRGLIKYEDGFPGTIEDLVSADVVRFKLPMSRSDDQIVSLYPATPSLRPFFNDCFKVMDSPTFLKK